MINQTQAAQTATIKERSGAETLAVNALVFTYLMLFSLYTWYEQFLVPYIYTDNLRLYWEVIKTNPFSEVGFQYAQHFLREIRPLYILQWAVFIIAPIISMCVFLIARNKLKKMPRHDAAEGGKLSVLGRTLALFIEGKWQLLMIFSIGYSFFATAGFAQWIVDFAKGDALFDPVTLFFPFMSVVLVWLFIRPFFAFYTITINKKSE
ncbi:hypothetical protein GCM10007916_30820 [Psychromonas marina]|uniref:DUF2975 domain-containing protein n=1 Tax=Psychromonas marina TaxID=88364 RepID=A0ABQ6E3R3_9GAMM|nr:hypothetical protein [Psychromonas marina]GLS92012.1 hypothetical protein GCM10007916_30820 [Psychromonas marina]